MVQEFYILKCSACNFFQVQIVKKAKTWICKICNFKQSVIKVFGQGAAKECRLHVQKLNQMSYNKRELEGEDDSGHILSEIDPTDENDCREHYSRQTFQEHLPLPSEGINSKGSKWSMYLDEEEHSEQTPVSNKRKWNFGAASIVEHKYPSYNVKQNPNLSQCVKRETEMITPVDFDLNEHKSSLSMSFEAPSEKLNMTIKNTSFTPADTRRDDGGLSRISLEKTIQSSVDEHLSSKPSDPNTKISCSSRLFSTLQEAEDIDALFDI